MGGNVKGEGEGSSVGLIIMIVICCVGAPAGIVGGLVKSGKMAWPPGSGGDGSERKEEIEFMDNPISVGDDDAGLSDEEKANEDDT